MWTCPKCKAKFFQKNLWHSCGNYTVKEFFNGKPKEMYALYKYYLHEFKKFGPVIVHPVKTRIAFMVEVRFSGVTRVGKNFLASGLWLTEPHPNKKFSRIEKIADNCYLHRFKLYRKEDIDDELRAFMRMAYAVGKREHIKKKNAPI
ncbi:MAG: hypothetical protein EPO24_15205 [Bacteroidetes bacterium]|nr:MAG: hypothetical protein EPO24_15205 [Bacteroidota bacterium]